MTESRAKTLIAAVTSTLYDLRESLFEGICPASQVYLALGMNLSEYQTLTYVLSELGLCEVTSETIKLTSKGEELGKKCSEVLTEAKDAS